MNQVYVDMWNANTSKVIRIREITNLAIDGPGKVVGTVKVKGEGYTNAELAKARRIADEINSSKSADEDSSLKKTKADTEERLGTLARRTAGRPITDRATTT